MGVAAVLPSIAGAEFSEENTARVEFDGIEELDREIVLAYNPLSLNQNPAIEHLMSSLSSQ